MGRIRSIKPEFPQSESVGRLSRDARLLFIQLWTIVDDDGRARAATRVLAGQLYPYDDDAPALMPGWLEELEREGCIARYVIGGSTYVECLNWAKHQKIDHPSKSKLPPRPAEERIDPPDPDRNSRDTREPSREPREASDTLAPDLGPRTMDLGPVRAGSRTREAMLDLEQQCRDAAGVTADNPAPALADMSAVLGWIDQGISLEEIILPTLRATPKPDVRTWSYFRRAVLQAHANRLASAAPALRVVGGGGARASPGTSRPLPRDPVLQAREELLLERTAQQDV